MRSRITLYLLLIPIFLLGQEGFSVKFDFGTGAGFHNVLLKEDTIIVVGTTKNDENTQWGLLFAKLDTLGNLLSHQLHIDTMEGQYAFDHGYPFIHTPDGGYLAAGVLFNRESYFIMKLSVDGELEFMKEYPETNDILTRFPHALSVAENGYMIFSRMQRLNGMGDLQATKTDFQGEVIWVESYGTYEVNDQINSSYKIDEDTYIIGGSQATDIHPVLNGQPCLRSWFFAIDSLGEVKWEHFGEPCETGRSFGLRPTDDGGWVYATSEIQVYDQSNFGYAPKLMKLDSGFNVDWERKVGESYGWTNVMIDFEPTPDGGYVGVGSWVQPEPYYGFSNEDGHYIPGSTMKFSSEGDSIWARFDTLTIPENTRNYEFGGMVMLPSGSSISVGSFNENPPGPVTSKSWAWAHKLDRNGCLDNDCIFTSTREEEANDMGLKVYPNPASSQVTFEWDGIGQAGGMLTVSDLTGKVVWEKRLDSSVGQVNWEINALPKGIYIYQIKWRDGHTKAGKLII